MMMGFALFEQAYVQRALLAGLFTGVSCSMVGVFMVTTHLSFLGVCIAHAAFAGALFGLWAGIDPLTGALVFSLLASISVGPLADRGQLSPDASAGIVFSLMLGLAFLFLGMTPGSRTQALSLFWGNILAVTSREVLLLALLAIVLVVLTALCYRPVQAVICHRLVARAVGVPATLIFYLMLLATGATIALSLSTVGGLLIYSLLLNPAAAAYQLTYRLDRMYLLAAIFGVISCWTGLAASYWWDLPTGACIVLTSGLLFAAAMVVSPKRRTGHEPAPTEQGTEYGTP